MLSQTAEAHGQYAEQTTSVGDKPYLVYYGRNIQVRCNLSSNGDVPSYSLLLKVDGQWIEKAITLRHRITVEGTEWVIGMKSLRDPICVDFNSVSGQITFLFQGPSIFIATCNLSDLETVAWDEITIPPELRFTFLEPSYGILLGDQYYCRRDQDLGVIDLGRKTIKGLDNVSKVCRSVVQEGDFRPLGPKFIRPIGGYGDVAIVQVPISTDTGMERLVCTVRGDQFLGAIHEKDDGTCDIIGADRKVRSEVGLREDGLLKVYGSYLFYFPSCGAPLGGWVAVGPRDTTTIYANTSGQTQSVKIQLSANLTWPVHMTGWFKFGEF